MIVSSRSLLALGLGLVGLGLLLAPARGQNQDEKVQKSASQAASAPKASAPAVFGTIDMSAAFKGYDKVKASSEEFKASALAKQGELTKLMQEGQQEAEMLAKMAPGSPDFKKHEDRITQLKASLEASRESAQREFSLKEAEMLATIYGEIQEMVAAVATHKGLTYVLRVSNEPVNASNPNTVMAAIEKSVVYADPKNDITRDVVYNLNLRYNNNKKAGGAAPKAAAASPAQPSATK